MSDLQHVILQWLAAGGIAVVCLLIGVGLGRASNRNEKYEIANRLLVALREKEDSRRCGVDYDTHYAAGEG